MTRFSRAALFAASLGVASFGASSAALAHGDYGYGSGYSDSHSRWDDRDRGYDHDSYRRHHRHHEYRRYGHDDRYDRHDDRGGYGDRWHERDGY